MHSKPNMPLIVILSITMCLILLQFFGIINWHIIWLISPIWIILALIIFSIGTLYLVNILDDIIDRYKWRSYEAKRSKRVDK